jgi:peptidylprolyl isomerase
MIMRLLPFALAGAALALPVSLMAEEARPIAAPSPGQIVEGAPKADWVRIAPTDLLVMDLAPGPRGARRVVIQLMPPPFSQGWVGNVRKLAAAHWWDGLSVYRVQDNYVAQWGDADGDDTKRAKALPQGLAAVPESDYVRKEDRTKIFDPADIGRDPYATNLGFLNGWPLARNQLDPTDVMNVQPMQGKVTPPPQVPVWPVHCYAMVGVARDLSPNTGSGAELYTVIGHAPRQLDRNIALIGRVIEGIELLSSLPRGTGAAGFYEKAEERTPIVSVRLGTEAAGHAAYEYLSTESESFARYAAARANRRDPFFIAPAGGADICNIPVPVRRVKG